MRNKQQGINGKQLYVYHCRKTPWESRRVSTYYKEVYSVWRCYLSVELAGVIDPISLWQIRQGMMQRMA